MHDGEPEAWDQEHSSAQALARVGALVARTGDPADKAALAELGARLDPVRIRSSRRLALAAQLVNASLTLDAVLAHALELAVNATGAERGFVILAERRRIAARRDYEPNATDLAGLSYATQNIVERVLASGETILTEDAAASSASASLACIPLRIRKDVLGALYVDSQAAPGLFEEGDRENLTAFGRQAALAIENARMFEQERERLASISALKEFQSSILEAIANGVVTFSPRRTITTFNAAAETTFGVSAGRMVGKAATAICTVIPEFMELLETFFASGAVQLRAEVDAMRSDGTDLTLEMRLSPLVSAEGTGMAMVVTDVTQQRNLEVAHAAQIAKSGRVQESFSRYLAPHVVKSLIENPGSLQLGGERRRATMFFADVRGFTAIAAHMPVDRVVEILNTYFDEAVKIVFAHDGLLDKFYGDGLMAVFGPPHARANDAARAVAAAIDLHGIVARLRMRLDHPLQISVGLATGEVVAGHFGSAKRMDYTVIGDAVNLASGLQSAAPAGAIYCDEATIVAAGKISQPVGRVSIRVKGRTGLVPAFAIFPKPVGEK